MKHPANRKGEPLRFALAFTFAVLRQPIPRKVAPQQSNAPFRLTGTKLQTHNGRNTISGK